MGQFKCLHWQFRQQEGQHRPCLLSKVLLRSMQTSSSALPRASSYTGHTVQQNEATAESKAGTSSMYAASNEGSSMGGTSSTYTASTEGDSTSGNTSRSTDSTSGNSKVGTRCESSDSQKEPREQHQEDETQKVIMLRIFKTSDFKKEQPTTLLIEVLKSITKYLPDLFSVKSLLIKTEISLHQITWHQIMTGLSLNLIM